MRSIGTAFWKSCVVVSALVLAGCSPFGVVAGVGAGVGAATLDERGLAGTADDTVLRVKINGEWASEDPTAFTGVGLMIHEGNVVLTGTVDKAAQRTTAVRLVRGIDGVKRVYDHIRIDPNAGMATMAEDNKIIAAMRRSIFFDADVLSLNYNLDASGRTLFIQGIAQSLEEKHRVLAHARDVSGVRNIIEYIRIKDPDPIPAQEPSA
jgi:osmotically-inducible protein OsmY